MNPFRPLVTACAYGFAHGLARVPYMKTYDGKHDALPGTKMCAVLTSSVFAVSLFPIYMFNDMNRFYIYANKLDPQEYGYKTTFNDIPDILFN